MGKGRQRQRRRRQDLLPKAQALDWEPPAEGPVTKAHQAAADRLGVVIELGIEAKRLGQFYEIPPDIPRSHHRMIWGRIFSALNGRLRRRDRAAEKAAIDDFVRGHTPRRWSLCDELDHYDWAGSHAALRRMGKPAHGRDRQHGPVHIYGRSQSR